MFFNSIRLCADICKRNGKAKLLWLGDKDKTLAYEPATDEMVLTVHRWFANKSCPGNWLMARMSDLAAKVTAALGTMAPPVDPTPAEPPEKLNDRCYRVRKTWEDRKSQIGAYKLLANAKKRVDANPGYIVFDNDGNAIYPTAVTPEQPQEPSVEQVHTVVKGDTLWGIAKQYLGSGFRYTEIVKLNGLKTSVIYSGQKLKIPQK